MRIPKAAVGMQAPEIAAQDANQYCAVSVGMMVEVQANGLANQVQVVSRDVRWPSGATGAGRPFPSLFLLHNCLGGGRYL